MTLTALRSNSILLLSIVVNFLLISLISISCNESLPRYEEPQNVYAVEMIFPIGNPDRLRMDINRCRDGISPISVTMTLWNTYHETISGLTPASLGRLDIWCTDNPTIQRSISIDSYHEWRTDVFEPYETANFNAGDSSMFIIDWRDWKDNNGTRVWEYADPGEQTSDTNNIYNNKKPLRFTAQAFMTPLPGGPTIYSDEIHFTVTFYTFDKQ